MKQSDIPTFSETFRISVRSLKDLNKYCPGLIPSFFICGLFSSITPYVAIYLSAQIINELAGLRRPDILWNWVIITVGTELILALINAWAKHWKAAREDAYHAERRRIYSEKMLNMDYADIDKQEIRDKLNQIIQNEYTMGWGMGRSLDVINKLYTAIIQIFSSLVLMISMFTSKIPEGGGSLILLNHPIFIPVLFGFLMLCVFINTRAAVSETKMYAKTANEHRHVSNVWNVFGGRFIRQQCALDVRTYNLQNLIDYYNIWADNWFLHGFGAWFKSIHGVFLAVGNCIPIIVIGVVYVFVCLKAMGGAFGIGSVSQYIGAATALVQSVTKLLKQIARLQANIIHLRTTYDFLDTPNSMYQGSLPTEKRTDREYDVEFRNVSFKYPGSDLWALRHVNMKFKVGKRLAIVGENGSGKTTFIKLLCRLYDPQEGQILLNGIDIRKYNYRDYMDVFSIVFQDFQLLSQPLCANVAGASEYDSERVIQALTDSGFGDHLTELPDGLETMLYKDFGENGVEVSGGEAQKIAIARALYKDAPFIILDEPTAALDPIAEAEIYSKFNDISGDKTAIYISHRLSSCKFCDEIAVFHEGHVIQQGTHDGLLADEDGKYYALWNAQAQYYTEQPA